MRNRRRRHHSIVWADTVVVAVLAMSAILATKQWPDHVVAALACPGAIVIIFLLWRHTRL
jgi:hypothetical protein